MSTKIKSHRIDDGAIDLRHLRQGIKIPESSLQLQHPTHSNAADLTVEQKNTMTLGGNADALHYHTGGGGGPQGIYTNEQRDIQLLKLSMMLQSSIFGLDNAIRDTYEDDSGVFKGYSPANGPVLECLTDNPTFPGTLRPNAEYSYGVSFKNYYGQTNVMKMASIVTGDSFTNSVKITIDDIPTDNTGMSIYRTEGSTERMLVGDETDKWENPHGVKMENYTSDKTAGTISTAFTYPKTTAGDTPYVSENLVAVDLISTPLTQPVNTAPPFDFFLMTSGKTSSHGIEILWDIIPSFAPRDYEVYYTKETQIKDFATADWKKFTNLSPAHAGFKVTSESATDGDIQESYRIINNTKCDNKFYFDNVDGITYIRIRVTRIDNVCRLRKVNLIDAPMSITRPFFLDLSKEDVSAFNTLKFDYKTTGNQVPLQVEASRADESVSAVVNYTRALTSGTNPEYKDSYGICKTYQSTHANLKTKNRVRIKIRVAANSDFRMENVFLRLTTDYNVTTNLTYYTRGLIPEVVVPITWGGKSYIESFQSGINEIYSDWVYLPMVDATIQATVITFKHIRGICWYDSYGNNIMSYATANAYQYQGKENLWSAVPPADTWLSSRGIFQVEFGATNSISTNLSNQMTHNKWHKAYLDIGGINTLNALKFFTGAKATDTGSIILDNFKVTKNENLLNGRTSVSTAISVGGSIDTVYADDFGLNKEKRVMFNQYATVVNPQIAYLSFGTPQRIGQINFTCRDRNKAPSYYYIQYSMDDTAQLSDQLGDPRWFNVTNMVIGESSFDIGFTGIIQNGKVSNNNIANTTLAHRFDSVDAKKIRVWIVGTIGGDLPLINNIAIFNAADSDEMKLIMDFTSHIPLLKKDVIDDGLTEQPIEPSNINTTGSYNVIWNKDKKCIELINPNEKGVVYTNVIHLDLFQDFIVTAQTIGNVSFETSFDNGKSFVPISLDTMNTLPSQSDSIVIKATLNSSGSSLHAIAMLYGL